MDTVKTKISDYLAGHHYLRLKTVTGNSTPQVHTVGYASEDCSVFLQTEKAAKRQIFPGLEKMPANPDLVIFRVDPVREYFLDNTVAFGHRYRVEF